MEREIWISNVELAPACPRCGSTNTKFCYYNNYSLTQPRYFCKGCRRYWTKGGSLRNDDLLLPNGHQDGLLVTPSFEFSSMINMEFMTDNLGQESRLISDGDGDGVGVYFSGNHSDLHDPHYTNNLNVNANNIINHDQLGNNYKELPPLPGEEMMWSNSHDNHMVFPNDILNTSHNSSVGGPEPEPESESELAVQDPSHHDANNANDGSLFSLSNFGNIFRP